MTRQLPSSGQIARDAVFVTACLAAVAGVIAVVTGAAAWAVVAGIVSMLCAASTLPLLGAAGAPEWEQQNADRIADFERRRGGDRRAPESSVHEDAGLAVQIEVEGILTDDFIQRTLEGRVAVARRALRPLSIVYFEALSLAGGPDQRPVPVEQVGDALGRTVREADVAGRVDDALYVLVLEDTGEDGAVWAAERVRRTLADVEPARRFRAGIACYPNHGLSAEELQQRAVGALELARDWSRDRIEVASTG